MSSLSSLTSALCSVDIATEAPATIDIINVAACLLNKTSNLFKCEVVTHGFWASRRFLVFGTFQPDDRLYIRSYTFFAVYQLNKYEADLMELRITLLHDELELSEAEMMVASAREVNAYVRDRFLPEEYAFFRSALCARGLLS